MMQESVIEHFFTEDHTGSYKDMQVQLIDRCDPSDHKKKGDFWIFHLDTMSSKGLNQREAQ